LNLIRDKIRIEWSPEQVSFRFAQLGIFKIHWVTIYRQINREKRRGSRLFKHLRQAHKKRRKGYGHSDYRGILRGKRNISERPMAANERSELGHGEADLVQGYNGQGYLLTVIDRKSRLTKVRKIGEEKSKRKVNRKLIQVIKELNLKTLTVDNGPEFHGYKEVENATGVKFYFANPHHSWERGSIENTNGLIRQYFPKSMSLIYVTQERCDFVEIRLNQRPRKILNFKTPEEFHNGL
jgi:IS30 family transposase